MNYSRTIIKKGNDGVKKEKCIKLIKLSLSKDCTELLLCEEKTKMLDLLGILTYEVFI
jgi:hypothetical protein